ncbi:MAG: electron transfer flavoprotein subunit alpha/FixB family protein [Desulfosarcinaceae bacterium]|nr:electron transfer flavoprotein subunit alpha/FixB family protein [Desulfosarcinaceae bacterium]
MASGVFVFAEQVDNGFKKSTLEAVSEGRRLADALGEPLCAMVMGGGIAELAGGLGTYGVDKVLASDDTALIDFAADAYTQTLHQAIQEMGPRVVLAAATVTGKELFARLAAKLDTGLAMECSDLAMDGDALSAKRSLYGGKVIATVTVQGSPMLATLRPNVSDVVEAPKTAEVVSMAPVTSGGRTQVVDKQLESGGKVELTEANFVVSGGRGMGGPDYSLLEELAKSLGGAVGASRNAVDEGWRPVSDQVGQTGKVVSPKVYFACGISGAIQHVAGIRTSDVIVAINKDDDAPIFRIADYGVKGDLNEVVPAIIAEVKKLKG